MQKELIVIFLIFLSLFTASSCFRFYPSYEEVIETRSKIEPVPFTREKWFDDRGIGVEELWITRPGLARDLINRNLLIGKNYQEVQELLAEQEKDEHNNSMTYALFYDMGAIDPVYVERLYIKFDKNNLVESNEIRIKMMDGHPDYR